MIDLQAKNNLVEYISGFYDTPEDDSDRQTFKSGIKIMKILNGYDLVGISGETLFAVFCSVHKAFGFLTFKIFADHGIKFHMGTWEYLDKLLRIKIAKLFWLYRLEFPIEFCLDYPSLIDWCLYKDSQERLFAELSKDLFKNKQLLLLHTLHSDDYWHLFDLCASAGLFHGMTIRKFGNVTSLRAIEYFYNSQEALQQSGFPRIYMLYAVQHSRIGLVEFLLRINGPKHYLNIGNNDKKMFMYLSKIKRRDAKKICFAFIKCCYWDHHFAEYIKDDLHKCATYYFPGLENIVPDSLPMSRVINKVSLQKRYERTKDIQGDIIIAFQ